MGRIDNRASDGVINAKHAGSGLSADFLRGVGAIWQTGSKITAQVKSGRTYQGMFQAYPVDGRDGGVLMLKHVSLVTDEDGKVPAVPEKYKRFTIQARDLVKFECKDVPNRGDVRDGSFGAASFATDKEIGRNRGGLQGRELEKWVPPADSDGMGLEDVDHGPGKGGAKWDQFQANARLFNVKSTYDEDLYTTKLDVRNSNMTVAEAERLAAEIQSGNTGSAQLNAHLAEERGMELDDEITEEDRYGSVLRAEPTVRAKVPAPPATPALPRERDAAKKSDRNGTGQSRPQHTWGKESSGAGESRLHQREAPATGPRVPTVSSRTAPVDIMPNRRDSGRPLEHLQSGSQVRSPYGTSSFKSPLASSADFKHSTGLKALDLQVPVAKFSPETLAEFERFKADKVVADDHKSFVRSSMRTADGSLTDSQSGRNGLDGRSMATTSALSTSQKSATTPQKGIPAPPVALGPSNGMPSSSIVAAAGGTAATGNASATSDKAASDALPVPPLNPKPVLPGTAALPVAKKSTLNPLAKEWTPGGATKTAPVTAAATPGQTPAAAQQHGNSGPGAFQGPRMPPGQGNPYFHGNMGGQGPGDHMMGPGGGQGSGGRRGVMGPNGVPWESNDVRLQNAGPGKGRVDRDRDMMARNMQNMQQFDPAMGHFQGPQGPHLVPGPHGPQLGPGNWMQGNFMGPPTTGPFPMGGNPMGGMPPNSPQGPVFMMQPNPGFQGNGMNHMQQMPPGYMAMQQQMGPTGQFMYGGPMGPMQQGPMQHGGPRGGPQWQGGGPHMVPPFMQGGPGMPPHMMQQGHMEGMHPEGRRGKPSP